MCFELQWLRVIDVQRLKWCFMRRQIFLCWLLALPLGCMAQGVHGNDSTRRVALSEVVVEGAKVVRHNGYDAYLPSQSQRAHSANALDLLSQMALPGIRVDQVQKTVSSGLGSGSVVVKINNVEATLEQLQSILPAQVVSVEYTDTPGMKYGAGVGAVINVRIKRDDFGVAAGVNAMNAVSDNYNDDGVWAKLWTGKSEFGLQYNFKLNNVKNAYTEAAESFTFGDGTVKSYEKDGAFRGGNYRGDALTLSYNYALPGKRVLDIKGEYAYDRFPNRLLMQNVTGAEEYALQTNTQSDERVYMLKSYYEERFTGKDILEMSLGLAYLDNAYQRGFASPWTANTYAVDGDKYVVQANLDYTHVLSAKNKLAFGLQEYGTYTGNKYVGTNDFTASIHYDSQYAYAEYSHSFSKLYLSAGVGGSRIHMSQPQSSFTFYLFRPQLLLQYSIDRYWKLVYRYNRKPTSPSLADLTDYTRQDDMLQATVGNTGLEPYNTDTHLLLVNWNKNNSSFRLYGLYEYMHEGVGQTIEEQDGLFVHHLFNNLNHHHFEAAMYVGHSFWNRAVNFYVEPKWVYDHSRGAFDNKNTGFSLQAGVNAYYKQWSVSAYYRTADERLYGDVLVHNHPTSDINIGYRHQALQAKVGIRNVFHANGKTSTTETMHDILKSSLSQGNRTFGNMVYVSLSWSILKGKMKKTPRVKDVQLDTDSGIVK